MDPISVIVTIVITLKIPGVMEPVYYEEPMPLEECLSVQRDMLTTAATKGAVRMGGWITVGCGIEVPQAREH